jgi:Flp pilus assembly protein TadD
MTEPTLRAYDSEGRAIDIPRAKWAEEMLPAALASTADDPEQTANLISFALQNGCAKEVVEAAKRFARSDPDRVRGRNLYGAALAAAERFDEAEKEIENLLLFAGDDPTALVNLGQLKARKGDAAAASDHLRRALTADPNHAGAFDLVAQNARRRGGDAGFLSACRELAKDPRSWRARVHLARARLALGEADAALALYREALPHAAPSGEALAQISGDLANAGRLADAAELVGPVYRAKRHGPYVAVNLIRIAARLGRHDEAARLVAEGRESFGVAWKATFDALEREISSKPTETSS